MRDRKIEIERDREEKLQNNDQTSVSDSVSMTYHLKKVKNQVWKFWTFCGWNGTREVTKKIEEEEEKEKKKKKHTQNPHEEK